MSFYSYKNANAEASPGAVGGNVLTGLNKRVCIQVKNVYDSCLCQEQLDDKKIVISNIVPVLPGDCHGNCAANCQLLLRGATSAAAPATPAAAPSPTSRLWKTPKTAPAPCPRPAAPGRLRAAAPPPQRAVSPICAWSASATGPQFARVKATVGRAHRRALYRPEMSGMGRPGRVAGGPRRAFVHPGRLHHPLHPREPSERDLRFRQLHRQLHLRDHHLRHHRSEGARRGGHHGAHLRLLRDPPAEEYAESVCDEFFSLPLFPQSSCAFENVGGEAAGATTVFNGKTAACPGTQPTGGCCGRVSTLLELRHHLPVLRQHPARAAARRCRA